MIYCRFIDYQTDTESDDVGPFSMIQERYGELVDSEGEQIAVKTGDKWTLGGYEVFSDVVFFTR